MTKKSIIISIISVICLVGIAAFVMYGCSGGKENEEKPGASGQITVISREEGSGTRDAFVEVMGITDEKGNDITADILGDGKLYSPDQIARATKKQTGQQICSDCMRKLKGHETAS